MTRDDLVTCSPHIPFHHLLFRPFLPPPTTTRPVVFSRSLAVRPVPRAGQRKSPAAGIAGVFSNGSLKFNGRNCWTNTSKAGGWENHGRHRRLLPFARSAELCTPQIARASNFSPRDRSLDGATSRPAYTVFGHAKSFRLCALRSLGLSLACTHLRRAESQEFLDAGPENLTNNAATGRAETTYGASGCRPQAASANRVGRAAEPSRVWASTSAHRSACAPQPNTIRGSVVRRTIQKVVTSLLRKE